MGIAIIILWYLIGAYGFYYWWTKESDIETTDLILMILSGFFGVFIWVLYFLYKGESKVIFKKRK